MDDNKNLKWIRTLGTWFGLGDFPVMPGTIGTLGAIPLFLLFNYCKKFFPNILIYYSFYFIFLMTLFMVAVYISGICEEAIFHEKDPPNVVIDEVLGYMTTLFLVTPVGGREILKAVMAALVIFRILDITKPGPIDKSQAIPNGIGVVLDDFLAGIIGNFILLCIWTLLRWL
ncbi:MAG: phosphatidylglycerophosphatase A [Fusobacteriaceae bacterium]|jgi:phosphatidylglycerophosphatase A|nr:phosphatidylglycerophosphatase A [Fusobacteriaceae bacterium]